MELRIPRFDEIKNRFVSSDSRTGRTRRSNTYTVDDYDDFGQEDFGEYAFDDNADYAQPESVSAGDSYSSQMPKLVTADDVRSHTQYTPSNDAQSTRPNRDFASLNTNEQRSLTSHTSFNSNANAQSQYSLSASETGALPLNSHTVPAEAAPAANPAAESRVVQRATRILTVIAPESYAEAERLVKILKSGDVAVLSLRKTPDALGKRILDFSFGVACAFDARVECISGHVYAITRGVGLTEGERGRLRDQGLM